MECSTFHKVPLLSTVNKPVLQGKKVVRALPFFCFNLCIVLERKRLPEIGKVTRNWKSCQNVAEHLVDHPTDSKQQRFSTF